MVCSICDELVFDEYNVEDVPNSIIFFCRHAYHQDCLIQQNTNGSIMESNQDVNNPGSLTTKVNQSALLKSTQNMGCPLCREQAAGGNAFVNRMKSTKRGAMGGRVSSPQSPRADSIRSFGTVH
jgi:hypothetical protein